LLAQWSELQTAAAVAPTEIAVTEQAANALAVEWVERKDLQLSGVAVHFCADGVAEATGAVSVLGRDVPVVLRGTLDVSGGIARIEVDSARAGSLPDVIARRVLEVLLDRNGVRVLEPGVNLTAVRIEDGRAVLEAAPPDAVSAR
jgi:hypothetical protein